MKNELWYSVVVRDRHGKVLSRERRRSRSFLRAWNQLMFAQMTALSGAAYGKIKAIDGVENYGYPEARSFRMEAHVLYTGIICGTGDTAVAIDDYKLGSAIAHGVAAGQFDYKGMAVIGDVTLDGSQAKFLVTRHPVNNSGGTITVKEIGIYTTFYVTTTQKYMCAVRDVLETPLAVPDGGGITVDYTLAVVA